MLRYLFSATCIFIKSASISMFQVLTSDNNITDIGPDKIKALRVLLGTAEFKHLSLQIEKSTKLQIVSHLRISVNWPRGYKTFFMLN